jgi:hypothetical protein
MKSMSISISILVTLLATFLFFSKVVTALTQPTVPIEESLVKINDVLAAWTGYEMCDIISRFIENIGAILVWWCWDRTSNSKIAVALNKLASAADSQEKIAIALTKLVDIAAGADIAGAIAAGADIAGAVTAAVDKFVATQDKMAEALATVVDATGADTSNTADKHEKIRYPE